MKWILLVFLVAVTALLRFSSDTFIFVEGSDLVYSLGFIILFSFLIGKLVVKIGLPMITGYLLAGIAAGPQLSALMTQPVIQKLHLIDQIALGIIALTAGGELKLSVLKSQLKSISFIILFQLLLVYFAVGAGLYLLRNLLGFPVEYTTGAVFAMILFIATSAVANSPATAIAVITETKADGPITQRVIGITVAKDVIVLVLITGVIAFSKMFLPAEVAGGSGEISLLFINILISIGLGVGVGFLITLFLKYVNQDTPIFILGIVFAMSALAETFHFELVLLCVAAGFIVENISSFGDELIRSIEESSLPVYVIFFSIAGASLDLEILQQFWQLAMVVVLLRMLATWYGSYRGSKLAGDEKYVQKFVWTGFIGQAGITLGLAILVGNLFADSFGPFLKTVIVSTIVINQIIGPVIFRIGLQKADEIGRKTVRKERF
ncbi:MAG TPA: cation:proton antiporter [Bacteroidetes bacterium]|nr:cation:proton antiporter [Bacteroidota bacterium]